jgi:hypothetical protein
VWSINDDGGVFGDCSATRHGIGRCSFGHGTTQKSRNQRDHGHAQMDAHAGNIETSRQSVGNT